MWRGAYVTSASWRRCGVLPSTKRESGLLQPNCRPRSTPRPQPDALVRAPVAAVRRAERESPNDGRGGSQAEAENWNAHDDSDGVLTRAKAQLRRAAFN